MLDKELIKKKFKKSLSTYNSNATVQKKMMFELLNHIQNKKYDDVLEIGSYTGLFTKELTKKTEFDSYLALDIIDSFDFIKDINPKIEFLNIDVEDFKTDKKFDLIVSNASLQWCNDFKKTIIKLKSYLKKDGFLIISTFLKGNLFELGDIFGVELKYIELEDIKKIFTNGEIISKEEKIKFKTPLDILKHLKYTGVNCLKNEKLNYIEIKDKLKLLDEKYNNTLTYKPLYIIYQNKGCVCDNIN